MIGIIITVALIFYCIGHISGVAYSIKSIIKKQGSVYDTYLEILNKSNEKDI